MKFDEIHQLYGISTSSLKVLLDDLYRDMWDFYILGWIYAEEQAEQGHKAYPTNIDSLLYLTYEDGKDAFDRMEEAYSDKDYPRISRIAETESHRMFNAGSIDRAKQSGLKHKRWETMLDDKVRENHEYLQGVSVPIDAQFISPDGDSADYPGGFSNASNNVNCRCVLEFT